MLATRWITAAALLAFLAVSTAAPAAEDDKLKFDDLPKAVKKTVKEKFPEAKYRGISKEKNEEGEMVFEVEMTIEGKSVDIIIDDEGDIETIEKEIEVEDLPRAVIKAAKAKFSDAKIEKVEEVTDEEGVVVYEVGFSSQAKKSFEVVMSPNGKIIEKGGEEKEEKGEAKKKDKDDDDKKGEAKKKDKDDDDDEKGKKKEKDDDDDDKKEKKPKA